MRKGYQNCANAAYFRFLADALYNPLDGKPGLGRLVVRRSALSRIVDSNLGLLG